MRWTAFFFRGRVGGKPPPGPFSLYGSDLPLLRLIETLSTAPARLFGLPGGTLKPGALADLAIVDLDEPWIVSESGLRSRSKNTCFEGARLQGKVLQTVVAGRTVFSV